METVRIGVIGTGVMGQRHCRVYSNLRRVRLIGVMDADLEVGRRVARQHDAICFRRVEDLLENVDAVSIATPTQRHFDLAMHCLAQGIHVLVEKPMTETLEQAAVLAQTAEASDLVTQVGHIERFNPAYMELKNVLESLSVLAIEFRRLSPYKGSNMDVDVISDLMIHDIDLALDLLGQKPASVDAYGLTIFGTAIDHVVSHLCFDRAPLLTLTASRITEQKVRCIEVTAREAYIETDLLQKAIAVHRHTTGEYLNQNHQGIKYRQESIVERIHVPIFEPLFLELQHFVECILNGKPSQVPARAGLKTLQLAMSIRSAVGERLVSATNDAVPIQAVPADPTPALVMS